MILNGTSVRGIYLYADNIEFERGDFVVDSDCLYICLAENPTNLENNTVSGIRPSADVSCLNYKIYPGDKISTVDEYYDFVNEGGEDKYISSDTLCKILENSYFGIGDNGIIKDFVFYDSLNDRVSYSIKSAKEIIDNYATGGRRILNEILVKDDLNNGTLKISSNLIDLKDLLPDSKEEPIQPKYRPLKMSAASPMILGAEQQKILADTYICNNCGHIFQDLYVIEDVRRCPNCGSTNVSPYSEPIRIERIVSGKITAYSTGSGISGAKITITDNEGASVITSSLSNGTYSVDIALLFGNTFNVLVEKSGYSSYLAEDVIIPVRGKTGLDYVLNETVNRVLTGFIKSATGDAIGGATVSLYKGGILYKTALTLTSTGSYRIQLDDSSTTVFTIKVEKIGYQTLEQSVNIALTGTTTKNYSIARAPITLLNIWINDDCYACGNCADLSKVCPVGCSAVLASDGKYTIENAESCVLCYACSNIVDSCPAGAIKYSTPPRTVSGTVTDSNGSPLPGALVIIKYGSSIIGQTITSSSGSYSIGISSDKTSFSIEISMLGYQTKTDTITVPSGGSRSGLNYSLEEDIIADYWTIHVIEFGTSTGIEGAKLENITTGEVYSTTTLRGYISLPSSTQISSGDEIRVSATGYYSLQYLVTAQDVANHSITISLARSKQVFQAYGVVKVGSTDNVISGAVLYNPTTNSQVTTDSNGEFTGLTCYEDNTVQISATRFITEETWSMVKGSSNSVSLNPVTVIGVVYSSTTISGKITILNNETGESIQLSSPESFILGRKSGTALNDRISCTAVGIIAQTVNVTQRNLDGTDEIEFRLTQPKPTINITVTDHYTGQALSGAKVVDTNTSEEKTTDVSGRASFALSGEASGDLFEVSLENYITRKVTLNSTGTVDLSLKPRQGTVLDTSNNRLEAVKVTNVTKPSLPSVTTIPSGYYLISAYPGDTLRYEKSGYITQTQIAPAFPSLFPTIHLSKEQNVVIKDSLTGVAIPSVFWSDITTSQTGYTDLLGKFNPPTVPGNVILKADNYSSGGVWAVTETTSYLEMTKKSSTGTVIDSATGKGLSASLRYKTLKDKSGAIIHVDTDDSSGKFTLKFYAGEVLVVSSEGYVTKEYTITEDVASGVVINLDKEASTNGGYVYEYYDYQSSILTPIPGARVEISREIETTIGEGGTETYWVNSGSSGSFVFTSTGIKYDDEIKANKVGFEGTSRTITSESDPDLNNIILLLKRISQDWSLCEEGTQAPISSGKINNITKGIIVTTISATGGFTIEASEGDKLIIESDGYQTKELVVTAELISEKAIYLTKVPEEFIVKDYLTGRTLGGALVVVNGDTSRTTTSDSNGKFSLILKEKETIQISLSGYDTETVMFTPTVSHTVQLHKKKSSGHVYDKSTTDPISNVLVESSNPSIANVYTNTNGYFEIPIYSGDTLTFTASYYQPESVSPEEDSNLNIYLIRQDLGGYVKDSITGKGVFGATVTYGSDSVTTDTSGAFNGLELINGSLLKVTADDYKEDSYKVTNLDNVEIFIEKAKACIKVIDNTTDKPITGCVISYKTLRDRSGHTISAVPRESTSPGLYTITAYSGYELVASADGYEDQVIDASGLYSSWTADTDTSVPRTNTIRLVKEGISIAVRDSVLMSYLSNAIIKDITHGTQAIPTTAGHYKLNLYDDSVISISRSGYEGQTISFPTLSARNFIVDLVKIKTSGIVVVKGNNVPIAGAVVTNKSVPNLPPVTCSNVGEFSMSTWKGNTLSVTASGFKSRTYLVQNEIESSITIELEKEDIVEVIISGTVVDQVTGAKIGGAEVSIKSYSIKTISDSKGYFSTSLPTSGTFTFLISHEDYVDLSSTLNIPSTGKNDIVFRLTPKVTPDPEPTRVTVTGFVYDNRTTVGIPNAKVFLSKEGRGVATVYTDREGYYEITNVEAPYNYQFDITKDGYKSHTSTNSITSDSTNKLFYLDPEEQVQPDDRPIVQRGNFFILRQYTYVDTVRGDGNRFRIQELVDPYYGDIHFRYARSSEREGSKAFTYSIVSSWRSVFESSLSILDKLSAIDTHYNNKCIELENTKVALENKFCYKELNLNEYRADDGSISIPYITFSGAFSTTFPVTFTIKQVMDSINKVYKASSITIDLSDVIDSKEETYKIDEDLIIAVTYSNNSVNISASSSYDVIFKSAYYKQNYIPENE